MTVSRLLIMVRFYHFRDPQTFMQVLNYFQCQRIGHRNYWKKTRAVRWQWVAMGMGRSSDPGLRFSLSGLLTSWIALRNWQ